LLHHVACFLCLTFFVFVASTWSILDDALSRVGAPRARTFSILHLCLARLNRLTTEPSNVACLRALVSECIASEPARTPLLSARILDGGSRTTTTGAPPTARAHRAR
jgi:hypothetical protein